jgi:hypothetical protein
MKGLPMLKDWKNQHCENVYSADSTANVQCYPYQNPNTVFPEIEK